MLYYLLRVFIGFYSKVYFRKIYFTGLEKLPSDKPLILAANHPTAFVDPIIVGGNSLQGRNFMLRGDMFGKGKLVERFLRNIKCIPIYRFRDGFSEMKKNEEILQYCYDLLGKDENIFILAEGVAKHEKRMRPIQKGTARMAFGAYEKHKKEDIAVVPIGINYTDPLLFRSIVYADFGTPIPIKDFLADHEKNPRRAIKRLTDRLSKEMRKKIIHIAKETDDELGHQLLLIEENNQKEKAFPRLSYQPSILPKMWNKIERLNGLEEAQKSTLAAQATAYFDQLKQLGIQDVGMAQKGYATIGMALALLIGLPAFLVGIIGNFLPIQIGKYFAVKAASTPGFNVSLRFIFEMFAYMLYFVLLLIIALVVGNIWYIGFVILLPLFGNFSLQWLDFYRLWRAGRKVKALSNKQFEELWEQRLVLMKV